VAGERRASFCLDPQTQGSERLRSFDAGFISPIARRQRSRAMLLGCSSLTSCARMPRREASWGCRPATNRGFVPTIEPRIAIRRCDDESARCRASSRLDQRSASSPPTPPFTIASHSGATWFPALRFALSGRKRHVRGKSRPPQHKLTLTPADLRPHCVALCIDTLEFGSSSTTRNGLPNSARASPVC
jgi:hypothetical protein